MSTTVTDLIREIAWKGGMTEDDIISIHNFSNPTSELYFIYLIPNAMKTAEKATYRVSINKNTNLIETYTGENSPEQDKLIAYFESAVNNRTQIVNDMYTLIPASYNSLLKPTSYIMCTIMTDPSIMEASMIAPTVSICDIGVGPVRVMNEAPFESLIHSKPIGKIEIFKKLARRLVAADFRMVHRDVLIDSHPISRIYVYRDIAIAFYKDYAMYIGFFSNGNLPISWTEFTNVQENSLDTDIRQFLIDNWFNPES